MSEIDQTSALLAHAFPAAHVSRPEYLAWLYEESPFGPVIEANLDDQDGRAGHYALTPIALTSDGLDARGALSLNTAVHERARGSGTFVRLASKAIAQARQGGVELLLGVANANSTPGFVRRLEFSLLQPLPANVMLPTPGIRMSIDSGWVDDETFSPDGCGADVEQLLAPPARGTARRWTTQTLRWRCARPGARYALHRNREVLAISCEDRRHGVPIAILLKVFAAAPLAPRARRALIRAVCRFHRAPIALHVGLNDLLDFHGLALPARLRPSPLNLICRSLSEQARPVSIVRFELLDFDAY
jgi:hypothetical protein